MLRKRPFNSVIIRTLQRCPSQQRYQRPRSGICAFADSGPIALLRLAGVAEAARRVVRWCRSADSNRGPTHYECVALPTELLRRCDRDCGREIIEEARSVRYGPPAESSGRAARRVCGPGSAPRHPVLRCRPESLRGGLSRHPPVRCRAAHRYQHCKSDDAGASWCRRRCGRGRQ